MRDVKLSNHAAIEPYQNRHEKLYLRPINFEKFSQWRNLSHLTAKIRVKVQAAARSNDADTFAPTKELIIFLRGQHLDYQNKEFQQFTSSYKHILLWCDECDAHPTEVGVTHTPEVQPEALEVRVCAHIIPSYIWFPKNRNCAVPKPVWLLKVLGTDVCRLQC